jgi:RNA polymerase subunit RPABC4/transcription elongation factor Spt4
MDMFLLEWPGGSWEATAWDAGLIVGGYWAALWLAVTYWAARDIHNRTGNWLFQVLAVILVAAGSLPGLAVYMVLRPRTTRRVRYLRTLEEHALQKVLGEELECPRCTRLVQEEYLVCPACLTQLKRACASCTRPVDDAWDVCPYCLAERSEGSGLVGEQMPTVEPAPVPVQVETAPASEAPGGPAAALPVAGATQTSIAS